MHKPYTYLALGDSYTIGEDVLLQESFPYQIVQMLRKEGYDMAAPEIIAKTGWTSEELQAGIAGYTFSARYDFVSLLIGVNNQYRQLDLIFYKQQFEALLIKAVELAGDKRDHVVVLSIPDYGVTPFAKEKDTVKISKEIDEYNNLGKALCIQYKIPYVDITESARATSDAASIAEDGLHPSAKEYAEWAGKLAEMFGNLMKK